MLVILADSSYFYPINLISNSKQMKNRLYTYLAGWIFLWLPTLLLAQAIDGPTALFLMHSSGNHVAKDAQGGAVLEAADAPSPQKLTFIPDGNGYYMDYDLTTDGKVNDLTIQVEFRKEGNGYIVLLDDLHAM